MLLSEKDIIWIQTAFLGDIILSTASFDGVKKLSPQTKQVLITTPIGAAALKDHPSLDKIVVLDKKKSFLSQLRAIKKQVDGVCNHKKTVTLQLHKSLRSTLLAHYLKRPVITYKESVGSFFAAQTVSRIALFHEVQRQALLLEPLGVSRQQMKSFQPSLPACEFDQISSDFKLAAKDFDQKDKVLIGIAPGSVWGTKKWPAKSFAGLAQQIAKAYPHAGIVLIGSKEEKQDTDLIASTIHQHQQVFNIAGQTNLSDLRWLYPRLTLLVSNDSSPIHYASSFRVPTIAIFGATCSAMGFGPLSPGSKVIENHDLTCRPCSDHGPKICPLGHFSCMNSISVEQVMQEVRDFFR